MACGSCGKRTRPTTYVWTGTDGSTSTHTSETEANAKKARKGGTVKPQK